MTKHFAPLGSCCTTSAPREWPGRSFAASGFPICCNERLGDTDDLISKSPPLVTLGPHVGPLEGRDLVADHSIEQVTRREGLGFHDQAPPFVARALIMPLTVVATA